MSPKICVQFAEKVERDSRLHGHDGIGDPHSHVTKDVKALYSQAKRTERETPFSPPSSAEVNNACRFTFTSHMHTYYRA